MPTRRKLSLIVFILIVLTATAAVFDYQPLWESISSFRPWSLGLDLAGGSVLTYKIDLSNVDADNKAIVVDGLRDVIERRVNFFGVSEPRVYIEYTGEETRLIAELAGIRDVATAIKGIGETPFLDFRTVLQEEGTSTIQFVPTNLNGRVVKGAQLNFSNVTQEPEITIAFDDEGAALFEQLTEVNVGKPIAIFLDNDLLEMPVVREKISGGQAQITGRFTLDEARTFVRRFNAGALPAPITLIQQYTISPDFGIDSLDKAVLAGFLGTLVVIFFMIVYYKRFGVFAGISLLMYIALTLAIFKLIPVTLTLAGVAGLILSIGMAVDANILVFERTKEELARGLTLHGAIEEGFRRAWTSIRDSNISTLITSGVLYYLTTSFVRGFALALFVGVIISMFSAITITRTLLRFFLGRKSTIAT